MLGHDPLYFEGSRGGPIGSGGGGLLATNCWLGSNGCGIGCCCCCTKWWCKPWAVTDNNLLSHKLRGRCVPRIPVMPFAGGSIVHVANHRGMLYYSYSLSLSRVLTLCFRPLLSVARSHSPPWEMHSLMSVVCHGAGIHTPAAFAFNTHVTHTWTGAHIFLVSFFVSCVHHHTYTKKNFEDALGGTSVRSK